MSRVHIFSIIIISVILSGYTNLTDGNNLFLSSDYRGAITKYKEIVDKGVEDSNVFYNLATSYLYLGEYGNALYWYYRTMVLEGASEDVLKNLRLAYKGLEEQGIPVMNSPSLLYEMVLKIYRPWISIVFVFLTNLLFFILILRRFSLIKKDMSILLYIISLVVIFLTLYISIRVYVLHYQTKGIVLTKSLEVKEGPSDVYKTLFSVDEGTMVKVVDRYQDFLKIESLDGRIKGWVSSNNVGILKMSKL
ncbi:MAG: SH3 domain-containing protein [Deltaproteobacteria bacterium]|nr:SH3 domain-containing protein [Deltaproteobacteria bacterium]